jgi:hypothetical protein
MPWRLVRTPTSGVRLVGTFQARMEIAAVSASGSHPRKRTRTGATMNGVTGTT